MTTDNILKKVALTLAIADGQQAALKRHALLQDKESRYREQSVNIHYDTRRLALRKAGIVLQLREQRSSWLQTVERQAPSECGLIQRTIWAIPYPNHFEFAALPDHGMLNFLERDKIRSNLIPLFETSFSRTTWRLEPASGVRIDGVLDRGWIAANGRRAPISELTLELVEGTVDDLYGLAVKLGERVQLVPLLVSRAERGYQLFLDAKPQPITARGVALDPEATPAEAFRKLALSCLTDMHLNHPGAVNSDDPEYVHQMRVAIRRLRAAIRIFKPVLPDGFAERVVPRMRELINVLGQARDLDVLTAEIAAPVMEALPAEPCLADMAGVLTERLYRARLEAVQALSQPDYGQQLLNLGRLLNKDVFVKASVAGESAIVSALLKPFSEDRLKRLHKKTKAMAIRATADSPISLHHLRIAIKHLRYGNEFFGSLKPQKSTRALVKKLTLLQDQLGQLNDLANAGNTLRTCAKGDQRLRRAVNLIAEWHGPRHEALLDSVAVSLRQLKKHGLKK